MFGPFCKQIFQRYIFEFIGAPLRREISKRASIYDGSFWMNGQWFLQFESLYGCNTISANTCFSRLKTLKTLISSYNCQMTKLTTYILKQGWQIFRRCLWSGTLFCSEDKPIPKQVSHHKQIFEERSLLPHDCTVSPNTLLLKCLLLLPPSNVSPTWHSHDD